MTFRPRSFQQIVAEMAATLSAETPINDYSPASVALTLLETAAQEDFQQYIQMIEVVRNYNLDTTEGEDLDKRAFEFGLVRIKAKPHSGFITITDSRFTKIQTKLYAGLPGPTTGSTTLFVDDASELPTSGSLYIGRGSENSEGPIAYSAAPVDNTSFWTISLDTALVNDHGTDETVILSQFGQRTAKAGTEVRIPENDFSAEVLFELNQTVTILDGEDSIENVLITALDPGGTSVPRNSIREFVNPPFTGAVVANPSPFVNGRDEETDQELRDRIRGTIQSLSRGTSVSVRNGILGIIDTSTNSSITSANVIPPVVLADGPTKVFIDNGRGLEPEIAAFGLETLISSATGGEVFFQLSEFPVTKANIISQLVEPFNLIGGETLILQVGTTEETFTFDANDFDTPGNAEATEAAEAINNRATLFEARTITDAIGARVIITPKVSENENIKLNPASSANSEFNFSTDEVFTLKLYKNDQLLTKDGLTAAVASLAQPFDFSSNEANTADDVNISSESRVVVKLGGSDDFRELVNPGDYVKGADDNDGFYTRVRTVVSANKLILETPYPVGSAGSGTAKLSVWSSPQLEVAANGDLDETEIVSFSKNDFATAATVLASEALTRIQTEVNMSRSELSTNDTQIKFTSLLDNSALSKMRILGGHAALAMGFTTSFGMTGTCNYNSATKIVTGVGTLFTTELKEGQWIKATAAHNGAWSKIETIENNTTLYLVDEYRGPSASGQASLGMTFGTESVGSDKDYTLNRSNGQIELVTPLVAGESLTAGSVNTRGFSDSISQPFNFSSIGSSSNLIVRVNGGKDATVTTGDASAPYNTFIAPELVNFPSGTFIGYHVECTSGENAGETEVVTGYTPATGQITVSIGFTNAIAIGDKFKLSQILEFDHGTDFVDDENVLSSELAIVINSKLKGGTATARSNGSTRIRTNSFENGSIQILGGTANGILNFPITVSTNQETNIASLVSGNSDRSGIADALGFTLSPNQNLVTIFDNDSANKTFATTLRIEGEVSSGVANSIVVSDFAGVYADDFFNNFWVYWKAGAANEGTLQLVTDFDGTTGTITTVDHYPSSTPSVNPVAGDFIYLVPRTAENLVSLFSDLNTTTITTAGNIAVLDNTGDYLQISSRLPGTGGKVFISGGTANSTGIAITGPIAGGDINDVNTNSVAGLAKGMPVRVTTNLPTDEVVYISDIQGTTAPYTVKFTELDGTPVDATTFTSSNEATIRDVNGLNFSNTQVEGVDGYKFNTGLIQLAQWTIDGLDTDRSNYPGIGAAGTQFEVLPPVLVKLDIVVNVTPIDGVSLSSISNDVASEVLSYVNARSVGENVILSEIIAAAQSVNGVFDVEVTSHTENIVIADGELARLEDEDLIIG